MMQSCASAAKLRSGGPILPFGAQAVRHREFTTLQLLPDDLVQIGLRISRSVGEEKGKGFPAHDDCRAFRLRTDVAVEVPPRAVCTPRRLSSAAVALAL